MAKLVNLAKMSTATTGTGTITLLAAVTSFLSFADAGVSNGDVISYAIEDGNEREVGVGTYTASGTTLTRTVLASTNGGAKLNLSGNAQVFVTALAQDLTDLAKTTVAQNFSAPQRTTRTALTSGTTITVNLADGNDRTLTLAHNAVIANPADVASYVGQKGSIAGQQDATGGRTLGVGSIWFPVGGATMPAIPSAANAKFRIDYDVVSASRIDFTTSGVGI